MNKNEEKSKTIELGHLLEVGTKQMSVGFTLSEATKALRECRGIALLYF
jgi:hypothetical protein